MTKAEKQAEKKYHAACDLYHLRADERDTRAASAAEEAARLAEILGSISDDKNRWGDCELQWRATTVYAFAVAAEEITRA